MLVAQPLIENSSSGHSLFFRKPCPAQRAEGPQESAQGAAQQALGYPRNTHTHRRSRSEGAQEMERASHRPLEWQNLRSVCADSPALFQSAHLERTPWASESQGLSLRSYALG